MLKLSSWRKGGISQRGLNVAVSVAVLAGSTTIGLWAGSYPSSAWLLFITAGLAAVAIWISPYNGLLIILILETFRVQDAALTGGSWLTAAKSRGC